MRLEDGLLKHDRSERNTKEVMQWRSYTCALWTQPYSSAEDSAEKLQVLSS